MLTVSRTRQLTGWALDAAYADFPQETIDIAKALLLKTAVGMLTGSREHIGKIITAYYAEQGAVPEAGLIGGGYRTTVENAAFAGATFAHASELEDNELPSITSDYWMLPAIFPLAQKYLSTGREVIESAVVAWEVASRFCRAAPGSLAMTKYGVTPPQWWGIFGVAAATARLAKLSLDEAEHALCISGTYCSLGGGEDAHFLGSGHTCQMGIQAALMSKKGATGSLEALERPYGIWVHIWDEGKVNLDLLNSDLRKPPYLINQVNIKKYGACTYSHTSIDALSILMRENNLKYEDIEHVETRVSAGAKQYVGSNPAPTTIYQSRFSLHYLLGEVMLRGAVDIDSFFAEERLYDAPHKEAAAKISVEVMPDVDPASQPAEVTVTTKDGRKLVKRLDAWIGSPLYPLTLEQLRIICRPYFEMMLDKADCERVEDALLNLEKQPDILQVMDILTFCRKRDRA